MKDPNLTPACSKDHLSDCEPVFLFLPTLSYNKSNNAFQLQFLRRDPGRKLILLSPFTLFVSLCFSQSKIQNSYVFLSKWNNLQLILKYKWLLFSEENLLQLIYKYYLIIIVNIVRNRKHFEYIAFTKICNSRFTNNLIKY